LAESGWIPLSSTEQIIVSKDEEVTIMPRQNQQNQQNMNPARTAAATPAAPNTATEFAAETNVAEVRRQNQQSAANAAQRNNPTE